VKVVAVIFKALAFAAMILTPLFGVWVASSLAAYGNGPIWAAALTGLLLFPVLPGGWELFARWRASRAKVKRKPFLTTGDRLMLRTLAINILFLVVLLAARPQAAFAALSTRGDWMLGGSNGGAAQAVRRVLFGIASKLEWLYLSKHENPYHREDTAKVEPEGGAGTLPTATTTPVPPPPVPSTRPDVPSQPPPRSWPFAGEIHPVVASMPAGAEDSIEHVGQYIKDRTSEPFGRAKALHDYVADRIAYDVPAWRARSIPPQDAEIVFRRKIGVCAGYSLLLEALGKAAGLEIVYVTGDARTTGNPLVGEAHAWNAVKIEGRWYLMDATWDAGFPDGNEFKKQYRSDYFLTPPAVFGVSHFPDNPKWQLMDNPVSRGDFFRRPMMSPAFYADGFELLSPDRSQFDAKGTAVVTLKNTRGMHLMAQAGSARCTVDHGATTTVTCPLAGAGQYELKMFANSEQYGSFHYVGQLQVNAD
jgi:hypothetical protein